MVTTLDPNAAIINVDLGDEKNVGAHVFELKSCVRYLTNGGKSEFSQVCEDSEPFEVTISDPCEDV